MNASDQHWHSRVGAPLCIQNPLTHPWTDTADLVIVGLGGAGVCAALEGLENGASVIAVERFGGGGDTALSGGVFYAGGGTRYQLEAGYQDSAENMFNYLRQETQGVVLDETLLRYCGESKGNLQWLEGHGVRFSGPLFEPKTAYPPEGYFLYWSGNERTRSFAARARPAPRGHRTVGEGNSGYALFVPLRSAADRLGLRTLTHSRVTRLVTNSEGAVVGVEVAQLAPGSSSWHKHKKLIQRVNAGLFLFPTWARRIERQIVQIENQYSTIRWIRARAGVILAAGGFCYNRDMVAYHVPQYRSLHPFGTLGADGSGLRLGQSVGGAVANLATALATRVLATKDMLSAIVVDRSGSRFCNEDAYAGMLGRRIAERPNGNAWLLLDADRWRNSFRAQMTRPGRRFLVQQLPLILLLLTAKKALTVEGLAAKCGISGTALSATVQAYNRACAEGVDPFEKDPKLLQPLAGGPYYAVDVSLQSRFATAHIITMGGLVVDEETGYVKRPDGTKIPGLFAAGRSSVGIASHFYVSGTSIGDCIFSGRRAGRCAADARSLTDT